MPYSHLVKYQKEVPLLALRHSLQVKSLRLFVELFSKTNYI